MAARDATAASREAPPPPGSKQEKILEAAADTFMELGYGGASMDEITRRAGVSKATVYARFAGKEELFSQVVTRACRQAFEEAMDGTADDVPAALLAIATRYSPLLLSARALAIYRTVVAEAPRFPELGRLFYEAGPGRVRATIAALLARAAARGELDIPNPEAAAERFFGMVAGHDHLRAVLGIPHPERAETPDEVVRRFLRAYAPER